MRDVDVIRKRDGGALPSTDVIDGTITAQAVP